MSVFFDPNGLLSDEEKKKKQAQEQQTPSQQAATEQKQSTSKFFSPDSLTEFEKSRPQPVAEPAPAPQPTFQQKLGEFATGIKNLFDSAVDNLKTQKQPTTPAQQPQLTSPDVTKTPLQNSGINIQLDEQGNVKPPEPSKIPSYIGTETISQGKAPSTWDKIKSFIAKPFKASNEELNAKAGVAVAVQDLVAKKYNVPKDQVDLNKVYDNLDAYTKELGIRTELNQDEFLQLMFALSIPVTGGLSLSALAGIGVFTAVSATIDAGISKITGKPFGEGLKSFLPDDTSQATKDFVDIIDLAGKAYATHGLFKKAPDVVDFFTRQKLVSEYGLPQTVNLNPSQVKTLFGVPNEAPVSKYEADIIKSAGLTSSDWAKAAKEGVSVQIPTEKIVTMTDKPYWAKLKSILGLPEGTTQIVKIPQGANTRGGFGGYLPEKAGVVTMTPDEIITNVNGSDLKGTDAGKVLLDAANKAQNDKKLVSVDYSGSAVGELSTTTPAGNKIGISFVDSRPQVSLISEVKGGQPVQTATPEAPQAPQTEVKPQVVESGTSKAIQSLEPYFEPSKAYKNPIDFLETDTYLEASKDSQVGLIDPNRVTPRDMDTLDRAKVDSIKQSILNGDKMPATIVTSQDGKLVTTEGTHRTVAYQELGLKMPTILNGKENVEGFKPITEYLSAPTKPEIKTEVKPEAKLTEALKAKPSEVDQALGEIFTELDLAEAGQRIFVDQPDTMDKKVIAIPSTFPKWIPEELRSKKLFEKVLSGFSLDNFQYPPASKPKLRALYDAILDEVDKRVGLDTAALRSDIIKANEPTKLPETPKNKKSIETKVGGTPKAPQKVSRSVERSSGGVKAPSGYATTGTYDSKLTPEAAQGTAELPNLSKAEAEKQLEGISAVQFPELVRLAKELTGSTPELNSRFKNKLGQARLAKGTFSAKIELNPAIFTDETLMAKVLAHELGHVADYFPEGNISRGNLIGRVATLNKYLKEAFGSPLFGTKEIRNSVLKKELKKLTMAWNPFDEKANLTYTKYRYSAAELYAEAISVLFNQPSFLKAEAPTFYEAFFAYLDKKPEVKQAFFDTWDLLNKGAEAIGTQRDQDLREMFKKGEDLYRMKILEKKREQIDVKAFLKNTFIDKNATAIDKIRAAQKAGKYVPDDKNPEFFLEGINYLDGYVSAFLDKNYQGLWKTLQDSGVSWEEDFGQVLFLERVINERGARENPVAQLKDVLGDGWNEIAKDLPADIEKMSTNKQLSEMEKVFSKMESSSGEGTLWDEVQSLIPQGIANPKGYTESTAKAQMNFLRDKLGEQKWEVLQKQLETFRGVNKKVLDLAEKEGLYSPDLIKQMKANPAYATFQVLDYLDTHIPSTIKRQIGTLKDIASPSTSTVMKNISILRAIERNKATRTLVEFIKTDFPDEIQDSKYIFNGRSKVPVESRDQGLKLVTFMDKGKYVGYYVDPYIAQATEYFSTPQMATAGKILRTISGNKLYRPLFITFNLGFQSFNLMRDALRFYKNVPTIKWWQVWKVPELYLKSAPASLHRAWDIPDALITEMKESKILSITYNDVIKGSTGEDTQMERILQKYDILKPEDKAKLIKPIVSVLDVIDRLGNFIETLPKVAGYLELQGKLPTNELASYIRKNIGSPDFMRKGTAYPLYNEVFLFSNAIKEGYRSDISIATSPRTRSGWWTKTTLVNFIPKLLMIAGAFGLFGKKIKEMFDNVSEYDMSNYTVVPIGVDKNGRTTYIRIPQDESGRFLSAILYKGIMASQNNRSLTQDLADIFSFTAGQLPTVNPTLTTLVAIKQYLAGENPYDYFRGRNVIPDTAFQAGGKYSLMPFLQWTFNNLGVGIFYQATSTMQAPDTKTWVQKLIEAPVLSNIIGRWVKVSDYGQYEKNQDILKSVRQQNAAQSLDRSQLIDEAITQYRSGAVTPSRRAAIEKKLISDAFGRPPYDPSTKAQITNTIKRFRIGVVKGAADSNINALISAQSNDEKLSLLKEIKRKMSDQEFSDLQRTLLKERIVSTDVFAKLRKETR